MHLLSDSQLDGDSQLSSQLRMHTADLKTRVLGPGFWARALRLGFWPSFWLGFGLGFGFGFGFGFTFFLAAKNRDNTPFRSIFICIYICI